MGRLSRLLHLSSPPSTSSTSQTPLPSLSTPLDLEPQPWSGNLPCTFCSTDGCAHHNPSGAELFFDPLLFPPSEKVKPSGNIRSVKGSGPGGDTLPETGITSSLPRKWETGCLSSLPRVHKSLPYHLSFYHVHFLLSQFRAGNPPSLSLISCAATTGSNPALSWSVHGLVSGEADQAHLLLEYTLSFAVKADLGSWTPQVQHGRAAAKEMLIGSGYRDFNPCAHTKIGFKSHGGQGKDHVRTASVGYVIVGGDGKERKVDWRSEDLGGKKEGEEIHCGKCFTDARVEIEMLADGAAVVAVKIWKDVGRGEHPAEEEWLSAAKGGEFTLQREMGDGGRMGKAFTEGS